MMRKGFNLLEHIRSETDTSIVIWIFNIGVEKCWNNYSNAVKDPKEDIVVNHIEEINLLLVRSRDYIILRKHPSKTFLKELEKKGHEIPTILCPETEDEQKSISELILSDPALIKKLTDLGGMPDVFLVPYGVSETEERIAEICGLHLVGGTNAKSQVVNNKIFAKKVAKDLGLPAAKGFVCHTVDEIRNAYSNLRKDYSRIIIKMPCNSSGQGMWVVENEKKLNTACAVIARISRTQKTEEWLVEGWIEKSIDLNIQVYISETGEVETFSVKEQIVEGTLYVGSVMPAGLSQQQHDLCVCYGKQIGKYLYSLGYSGVFGIDALVTTDGIVIPIIEINGRFTLSTYLSFERMRYPDKTISIFFKRMRADSLNYDILRDRMKKDNLWLNESGGIFIYNAATTDSSLADGRVRIFCMAVGENRESVETLADRFSIICNDYCI